MAGGADPIPGMGGGGIQFDTYPQDGQWLYVETTGSDTSPSGFGMEIYDSGGNGIDLASGGCHVRLNDFGSNDLQITAGNDLTVGPLFQDGSTQISRLTAQGVRILNADGSGHATIGSTGLDVYLRVFNDTILIDYGGDDDTPGNPIFRIDVAGGGTTYHILSGASWVADL